MAAVTGVRISIVDDHTLVRQTLARTLLSDPDLQVESVHQCSAVDEVLRLDPAPHLVLLDLDLGDSQAQPADVVALTRRGVRVLVVSALGSPETVRAMMRAGVAGFVSKREDAATLVEAVATVLAGQSWTTPELAGILVNDPSPNRPRLSPQEQRVLILYTSGLKLEAVARQLGIQPGTARQYLERIRAKYSDAGRAAPSKTALYQEALRDGLVAPPGHG